MKKHKETKTACISFKSIIFVKKLILPLRLSIKQGIPEPGTESGKHAEYGECYIPGNVLKHSGECRQIFWGMSSNIPGNIANFWCERR